MGLRTSELIWDVQAEELAAAKQTKQHLHQINRIKAIQKEIKKEEKEMEIKTLVRQEKKAENETRPGKYGPGKFMVCFYVMLDIFDWIANLVVHSSEWA